MPPTTTRRRHPRDRAIVTARPWRDPSLPTSRPDGGPTIPKTRRNAALDGLRGLAVIAVMAYHVVPRPFTGGWLGVDIFLVLSGFLICTMLLREQSRTGRIDYRNFLVRRARRLLPGLALMLLAVLALSHFLEASGRRRTVAIDVVSSALQVSNWRLILNNESYFANISVPSPIRHTWSLGAQEQFYILFPLVLTFFVFRLSSWRARIGVFVGLGALSLWRMIDMYVPETDPSRVYFGTDTRLFELLIGAVAAMVLWRRGQTTRVGRGRGGRGWSRRRERQIGWLGLLSLLTIVVLMFTVSEFSPWLFQGGLAGIALLAVVIITAATSAVPNVMKDLLAHRFLIKAGDMSYSLYIWHWPVITFLALGLPSSSNTTRQLLAVVLTIVISYVSFTYVEDPIHKKGLAALVPSRPRVGPRLAVLSWPAILVGAAILGTTTAGAGTSDLQVDIPATPVAAPEGAPKRNVVLVGASTAHNIYDRRHPDDAPDLQLSQVTSFGCTTYLRDELDGQRIRQDSADCQRFRERWTNAIERVEDPTVVHFLPTRLFADFRVDGQVHSPGSPGHDAVVRGILDEFVDRARAAGATRIGIVDIACHERPDFGASVTVARSNDMGLTRHLDSVVSVWAKAQGVGLIETYPLLCAGDTYHDSINGVQLYDDGLHYSHESSPLMWRWMAPRIREIAAG